MVIHKRKKYRKYLGSETARRGYRHRNRGAGNRGGRGMSGWRFKKQKYIKIVKEHPEIFEDKKGFISRYQKLEKTIINLNELEEYLDYLLEYDLIKKEGDTYIVNLEELGIDKLLGKGNVTKKMKVYVRSASKKAIDKIKAIGGDVITT